MKLKRAATFFSATILAMTTCTMALADDVGWYIGGNLGKTKADFDEAAITSDLLGSGFSTSAINTDNKDKGYKVYGGYQFNRHFALESGVVDLGKYDFTSTTVPAGTFNGAIKLKGIYVDLVGIAPLTEKLSAFGRVGVNYTEAKDSFSGTGAVTTFNASAKERNANVKFGAGLQYAFNQAWAARLEAERYRVDDAIGHKGDVDLVSLGVVYRFGTHTAPVAVKQTPVVAPPPPAPRVEKITLSSTTLFNFDKSDISTPPAELEQYTAALKNSTEPKQVNIVGYTDRLGSDDYNQKLSERRALAVKTYLVDKGVAAERLITEGKGEKDPLVECNDKNRAKLIECLQPNRRVQIDKIEVEREIKP